MSTPQDLQALAANCLAALSRDTAAAAAEQCLKDIAARDNPTTVAYEPPLNLALPRPQPTFNVHITINNLENDNVLL